VDLETCRCCLNQLRNHNALTHIRKRKKVRYDLVNAYLAVHPPSFHRPLTSATPGFWSNTLPHLMNSPSRSCAERDGCRVPGLWPLTQSSCTSSKNGNSILVWVQPPAPSTVAGELEWCSIEAYRETNLRVLALVSGETRARGSYLLLANASHCAP
jgi:hypothetical protein